MTLSPSSKPAVNAGIRAAVGGTILAGVAFFGALTADASGVDLAKVTGGAFFGYLAVRGAAEGWIDQGSAVQRGADQAK